MTELKFALAGAGALGLNILKYLLRNSYNVRQVLVRDDSKVRSTAPYINSEMIITHSSMLEELDVLFITVPDDYISEVVRLLPDHIKENTLVVHCSGAVNIDVIAEHCKRVGVFYPLQTFTRGRYIDLKDVPIFIEANHLTDEDFLAELGKGWSGRVSVLPSHDRLHLHCGAVFASNFVNHCLALSDEVANVVGIDYRVFLPLLKEVVNKLENIAPIEAQTGPAVRSDFTTLSKHMDLLVMDGKDQIASIYSKLNQSIQRLQKEKKEKVHN